MGQLLVSERDSNRIHSSQPRSHLLSLVYHTWITTNRPFEGHFGMAVDSQGIVYVTDSTQWLCPEALQYLASTWDSLVVWDSEKETWTIHVVLQLMAKITCISVSHDLQRISIFTSKGKFVRYFHVRGEEEKVERLVQTIMELAIDKSGNLYACKPASGQVVIF